MRRFVFVSFEELSLNSTNLTLLEGDLSAGFQILLGQVHEGCLTCQNHSITGWWGVS